MGTSGSAAWVGSAETPGSSVWRPQETWTRQAVRRLRSHEHISMLKNVTDWQRARKEVGWCECVDFFFYNLFNFILCALV